MKRLKAGIIGLGVGEQHIAGYHSHPNCEVVALCDFSDEKLEMAQEKYPQLKLSKDADELLNDPEIDVISIATYDNYHHDQIAKAITNGKHIFVEKPICLYEQELINIRALFIQNPHLKLSSNLILRMSPRFLLLKKMIAENELGELFYVEGDYNYGRLHKITEGWRGQLEFYSAMYGGGIHIIDLLLWLTGDRVIEVTAYGNNIVSKDTSFRYNDFSVCLLKFQSGMVGKVSANLGCVFPHFHGLSIYGTKATFVNGLNEATLYESRDKNQIPKKITAAYPGAHKGDLIYSFVDSIITGSEAKVSTEDVFSSMSVCLAIEKAIQRSETVKVDYI
jgi:predicted dehydrogenase